MRFSIGVAIVIICTTIFVKNCCAQGVLDRRISVNIEGQSITKALNEIGAAAETSINFTGATIPEDTKVSISADNLPFGKVLDKLLAPFPLTYVVFLNKIIIRPISEVNKRGPVPKPASAVVVHGMVTDKENNRLVGVTTLVKGKGRGTTTDNDGRYTIRVDDNDTLVFSYVGCKSQVIPVRGRDRIDVRLLTKQLNLGQEVMVVGYGTVSRITNTGAVSSIQASEIRDVPTSSVQNALAGKLPGFFSQQRSGQPGEDASDFFIRGVSSLNPSGNQPLIIVDGIEYTYSQLAQINVNEIQSISILKDASSTAIYGIKGANGVLIVKTRDGVIGAPQVTVRVESGFQSPVIKPSFLNSYQSALLVNEADKNDGLTPQFTRSELDHFKTGDDPYAYPDVNWYNKIFRPYSMQYNTNVNVSGGNKIVRYFVSVGAFRQNGNVRNFKDKYDAGNPVVNSNYYYRRYDFRSNLDVQASKSLKLRLDLTGRFYQVNSPHAGNTVSQIYSWENIHPYSAPFLNPNGSYAYAADTKGKSPTINALLATEGYDLQREHDMNILFGGTENLDRITEGLSFIGRLAYASVESNTRQLSRQAPPSYLYDPATGSYTLNGDAYVMGPYTLNAYQGAYNNRLNIQAYFNYDRSVGDNHFTGVLLFNRESYNEETRDTTSNWVPQNFKGFSFRAGYDFKDKYLFNIVGAYNGSDRFTAGKRFGFFPAISAGYNISNEPFFHGRFGFVDLMKIRASYGVVGSDITPGNRYLYVQTYNTGSTQSFGETDNEQGTIREGALGNPDVTWEKQKELDIGLDMNLFHNKFSMTADYFYNIRYDQLIVPGNIPVILGVGVSPENIARVRNRGFDGEVRYRSNIGSLAYDISGVFSFARNKILYEAEAAPAYPWLGVTGHPIGQPFGYTFTGYYQSQEDINRSAKPNTASAIVPGDLKYKDVNDDGVINQYDQRAIGKPNLPNSTAGLTLGITYKGLSVSALFQGAWGYSLSVVGTGIEPFQSQFQPIHRLAWTPQNAKGAKFPRLTTNPTTINSPSAYMSDFWLINVVYLRLKTLEIGYQLPGKWLPFNMSNARIYLSSYNLLTRKNYTLYQQDPEIASNTAGDAYLNQKVVNFGIQVDL